MSYTKRSEDYAAAAEIENRRALAESARLEKEAKLVESEVNRLEDIKRNRQLKQKAFVEFKSFVKDTLLQYVVESLMHDAVNVENMNEHDMKLMHHFSKTFIHENGGAADILFKAKGRTPLIEAIEDAVNSTTDEVIAKTDKDDPASFCVDKQDIVDCINKLKDSEDFQAAKEMIASKVLSAENQFVNSHMQDKAAIEEILSSTEEKINATENDRDMDRATKDAIQQEASRISKQKINNIRENKSRGVFDEMVIRYSKTVMKSDILKEYYLDESTGRLNTDNIVNSVRCMYAILETFSTTKIHKIDEQYIKNMLAEM